ncbi:hypothetical protein [Acetobacter estunensis]|uniref:hypothetical protein n=1 Tax=Acetobacter estunensis TaxID=104097 RepID=UPI0020C4D4C1|nr:hypothetical protein [Acetobacter estunensis]
MRSFVSKALLGATLLGGAPAFLVSAHAETTAHHHLHGHHHASSKADNATHTADSKTDDLNAKSLSAAQQDKVPAIGAEAPATTAPTASAMPMAPGMAMPTVKAPTVTAPSISAPTVAAPAAGTGVTAPALPTAPTTLPANAPAAAQ